MLQTALAMRTTTLRLGTAVIVLPWHNPVLLAEQAATLDLISGGRLDFGIGKGYRHNEFAGFRIPPEEAEPRFEESVEVMTKAFVSRAALLAPRKILAVRRHRGRAAAGAAAASAVLGRGRQRGLDPPRRQARLQPDPRPVRLARGAWPAHRALPRRARRTACANRRGSPSPARPMSPTTGPTPRRRCERQAAWNKRTVDGVARAGRQDRLAHPVLCGDAAGHRSQRALRHAGRDLPRSSKRCSGAGVEYVILTLLGGKEQLRRFAREVMPAFADKRTREPPRCERNQPRLSANCGVSPLASATFP